MAETSSQSRAKPLDILPVAGKVRLVLRDFGAGLGVDMTPARAREIAAWLEDTAAAAEAAA